MKNAAIEIGMTALIAFACATVEAQSWMPPAENQRCPSKWGAGDERGSGNHMKPASVLKAAKLIRTGEVIEIGHVLRQGIPLQATRQFNLHTKRTFMNPQPNQRGSNAAKRVHEFAFVMQPLKLQGATGSTVAPIAIR